MTAAIFIPLFIVAIVIFGFAIGRLCRALNGKISYNAFFAGVLLIIGGIIGGVILMFQPWTPTLFNLGFDLVLISTLSFTAWSHVTPKPRPVQVAER